MHGGAMTHRRWQCCRTQVGCRSELAAENALCTLSRLAAAAQHAVTQRNATERVRITTPLEPALAPGSVQRWSGPQWALHLVQGRGLKRGA